MQLKCLTNRGADLLPTGEPPANWRGLYFTADTSFELQPGASYIVYGMGMYNSAILVLVEDVDGLPSWFPIDLFEVTDASLTSSWEFAYLSESAVGVGSSSRGWQARWGYPVLVHSDVHVAGLVERDPAELRVFQEQREPDPGP